MSLSSFFTSTKNQELYSSNHQRDIAFLERFWRCNLLLHFLARRNLGAWIHSGAHKSQVHCFGLIEVLVTSAYKREIEIEPIFDKRSTNWRPRRELANSQDYFEHSATHTRHPLATWILLSILGALEIVSFYLLWLKAG